MPVSYSYFHFLTAIIRDKKLGKHSGVQDPFILLCMAFFTFLATNILILFLFAFPTVNSFIPLFTLYYI